jgi:hypothetical protein
MRDGLSFMVQTSATWRLKRIGSWDFRGGKVRGSEPLFRWCSLGCFDGWIEIMDIMRIAGGMNSSTDEGVKSQGNVRRQFQQVGHAPNAPASKTTP